MWFSEEFRVKDLFFLVGYDDSCLAAIRHVKSIVRVVKLRPNIRSHSVLFTIYKKQFRKFGLAIFVRYQAGKRDYLFRISVCPGFFLVGRIKKTYHLHPNRNFREVVVNGKQFLRMTDKRPQSSNVNAGNP